MVSNWTIRLANWTKKVFPVFPRNTVPRLKGPLPVFSALWDFFFEKILQRVPFQFNVLQQWMLKNPKGSPFSASGARPSGHMARQFGRLCFSRVWYTFCEFDTLSFDTFLSLRYFWALAMAPTCACLKFLNHFLNFDSIVTTKLALNSCSCVYGASKIYHETKFRESFLTNVVDENNLFQDVNVYRGER